MNRSSRVFLPVISIAVILSLVAISTWLSAGMKASDGLVLGGSIGFVWIVVALIWRKKS